MIEYEKAGYQTYGAGRDFYGADKGMIVLIGVIIS